MKKKLVVMSNFYRKFAVASVCTALTFALGANKEAKAATFTLTVGEDNYFVSDTDQDGLGDYRYGNVPLPVGIRDGLTYGSYGEYFREEYKAFYEFNIANLSLPSNTVVSSAIFEGSVNSVERGDLFYSRFDVMGYVPDGSAALSYFSKEGISLGNRIPLSFFLRDSTFKLDVTTFVNQIVSNGKLFAGFRFSSYPSEHYKTFVTLKGNAYPSATLTITTIDAEPVPEPTTIFGSVIALGVGGWLKRKNSSQQNKAKSQG
jgi:hypothetical protein